MEQKENYKKKIGIVFLILGLALLLSNYLIFYNIGGGNIKRYISQRIAKISGSSEMSIKIIDEYRTEYGLVILFQTGYVSKPVGYAVFEKDGFFNRYSNEDFAVYDNPQEYIGDSDAIIDLKNKNVFKFIENEIVEINSNQDCRPLINYYIQFFICICSTIYGLITLYIVKFNPGQADNVKV